MSLEYCTPSDIPEEISKYKGNVAQMNVGKSGKIGYLQLELQNDSDRQKTIITRKQTQVPLYVQKALHYDLDYPSMAHLFVLSPSGGILQGDRYRMDVELKNNAISQTRRKTHIRNPSRFHPNDGLHNDLLPIPRWEGTSKCLFVYGERKLLYLVQLPCLSCLVSIDNFLL